MSFLLGYMVGNMQGNANEEQAREKAACDQLISLRSSHPELVLTPQETLAFQQCQQRYIPQVLTPAQKAEIHQQNMMVLRIAGTVIIIAIIIGILAAKYMPVSYCSKAGIGLSGDFTVSNALGGRGQNPARLQPQGFPWSWMIIGILIIAIASIWYF